MQVKVENNIKEATTWLTRNRKDMPKITAKALNDTGFLINKVMKKQVVQYINEPNQWTLRGFWLFKATEKYQNVKVIIQPSQAKYMWYQIEGGTQHNKIVPVMANARSLGLFDFRGNVIDKASSQGKRYLIRDKTYHFGTGKSGRKNVYKTKGGMGRTTVFTTKDVNYKPRFPYYRIAEGVAEKNFDNFFYKQFLRAVKGNIKRKF